MSGGFDLHGRYYPNASDAENAERAQVAEINSWHALRDTHNHTQRINMLYTTVNRLQREIAATQETMAIAKRRAIIANSRHAGKPLGYAKRRLLNKKIKNLCNW